MAKQSNRSSPLNCFEDRFFVVLNNNKIIEHNTALGQLSESGVASVLYALWIEACCLGEGPEGPEGRSIVWCVASLSVR